jgi:hypothetical protein
MSIFLHGLFSSFVKAIEITVNFRMIEEDVEMLLQGDNIYYASKPLGTSEVSAQTQLEHQTLLLRYPVVSRIHAVRQKLLTPSQLMSSCQAPQWKSRASGQCKKWR